MYWLTRPFDGRSRVRCGSRPKTDAGPDVVRTAGNGGLGCRCCVADQSRDFLAVETAGFKERIELGQVVGQPAEATSGHHTSSRKALA